MNSRFSRVLVIGVFISLLALGLAGQVLAQGPVAHMVTAGGPDACVSFGARPGCDGNWSLVAIQYADGSVSGEWTDRFANGEGLHAKIICLVVEGNEAWISGVVTQGTWNGGESLVGYGVTTMVRDNGTSVQDPPDQISWTYVNSAVECTDPNADYEMFEAPQGQVTVR